MSDDHLVLNGISALTGEYLIPPLTLAGAGDLVRRAAPPTGGVTRNPWRPRGWVELQGAIPMEVDAGDLAETGWAVVFPAGTPDAVRQALRPLIDHRGRQAAPDRFRVLDYRPGEGWESWLARHGAHGTDVEPTQVPYYVLLVGGPEAIPFDFQFLLDINYAVGRLDFDRPEDYASYAKAVVAYETDHAVQNRREVVYWATRHEGDPATRLSADCLVGPMAGGEPGAATLAARLPFGTRWSFQSRSLVAGAATKAALLEVLHARNGAPPSVLFAAAHGMGGWPRGDPRQRVDSGALLCQDWAGFGRIDPAHYLTAAEFETDARLRGLIAFVFACYGAGTPRWDPFLLDPSGGPVEVADAPFVAALPRRMLAGGALAVIGHVDRAWGSSIRPFGLRPQLLPFRNLLGRLMAGDPVGHAMRDLKARYATASAALASRLDPSRPGAAQPADQDLVSAWVDRNDAQNFVLLGDPAARLRIDHLR